MYLKHNLSVKYIKKELRLTKDELTRYSKYGLIAQMVRAHA